MRFQTKLILVYESIFLIILLIVGFVITNFTYQSIRQSEFDGFVYEADNMVMNMNLYMNNQAAEDRQLTDYVYSMIDFFSKSDVYIEVYDANLKPLASSMYRDESIKRSELYAALENKGDATFISRHLPDGRYLAYYSRFIKNDNEEALITLIKDISFLDDQKKELYSIVLRAMLIGFLAVGLLVVLATNLLMRPMSRLASGVRSIASGEYHRRLVIERNDEFGDLAKTFNIMAEAVQNNIDELEEHNIAQKRMMDNLTHELRTPLTSIIGYADLLLKMPYNKEIFDKSLGYIQSEGHRMLNLNKSLMDLTYFEHKSVQFEPISVKWLLTTVRDLTSFLAIKKNIHIYIEMYDDLTFLGDKELLKSLLINLVDNAIKATDNNGVIYLSADSLDDIINIYVMDTGKGMPESEIKRILAPFYRVDKARSRDEGGLGLGLTIAKQIVDLHNGKMVFESKINQGTTVIVSFFNQKNI